LEGLNLRKPLGLPKGSRNWVRELPFLRKEKPIWEVSGKTWGGIFGHILGTVLFFQRRFKGWGNTLGADNYIGALGGLGKLGARE